MLNWFLIALGVLALAVGAVFAGGAMLPPTVSASRTDQLRAPIDRVFALVTDPVGQSRWRQDVASVTVNPGGRGWSETTKQGVVIQFEETGSQTPTRYALRFASPQGFSGEWVGTFETVAGGTRVVFTETVTTPASLGRVLARLFAPPGAHIDRYLADLKAAVETP